ncbi:VOC family protein [Rhizobium halophytocola]|uniref:Enzyme related to lactoylglutathione lyase n=1 Tax=Rhizobium halophytocola TaxID=735519 RepID=A0ABS4DTH2_9HYPH|nr:VOC family protein [Rhizobium halophytocola]MBP1848997.1 putative enzyme related to lactoylglutathione lyase [Rhizobium halophytocola]
MRPTAYILLYVADTLASLAFYEKRLGRKAFESFPTFASIGLGDGLTLGLWSVSSVAPDVTPPGGSEIGIVLDAPDAVDRTFADWQADGVTILQQPTDMVFGRTFLAADPDGHRIRVFAETAAA